MMEESQRVDELYYETIKFAHRSQIEMVIPQFFLLLVA